MRKWQLKEKQDEKLFQGQRVKGSGNRWHSPGDVKSGDFLIESKQTDKGSYSVSVRRWEKLSEEALFSFRMPLMSLQIGQTSLVVLSQEDFNRLVLSTKKEPTAG